MTNLRKAHFIFLIISLSVVTWVYPATGGAAYMPSLDSSPYGYLLDANATFQWVDASAGQTVAFSSMDDDAVGPLSLGFSFPFFDQEFTEFYIGTNGFLTFDEPSTAFTNQFIPRDVSPNGLIAPFWDDLTLLFDSSGAPISRVSFLTGHDVQGAFAVVEWYQVAKLGTSDFLSFEVILRDNGEILMQYLTLDGITNQSTVGIEGPDGIYGLQYLYNQEGLRSGQAIRFTRPAPGPHLKFLAPEVGIFLQNEKGTALISLKNSGDVEDVADLSVAFLKGTTDWTLTFRNAATHALLQDTNGNGLPDTGALAPGAGIDLRVEVAAPQGTLPGTFSWVQIVATSQADATQQAVALLQAAVPQPFAQVVFSAQQGVHLSQIWQQNQFVSQAYSGQFTGTNMAVFPRRDSSYVVSWEHNLVGTAGLVANVEYASFSKLGSRVGEPRTLIDNSTATTPTEDRYVNMVALPNGDMAVVWRRILRRVVNGENQFNENIYFAILEPQSGNFVVSPLNVTQNTSWRSQENTDAPMFFMPRIEQLSNGNLFLVWQKNYRGTSAIVDDLYAAIYTTGGSQVVTPFAFTNSENTGNHYVLPVLIPLSDNRMLVAYSITLENDVSQSIAQPAFQVFDSQGGTRHPETLLSNNVNGLAIDGLGLDGGNVILAWNDMVSNQIAFAVLNGMTYAILHAPETLDTPKGRTPSEVSVTQGEPNQAIITWYEVEEQEYLNYLLVDASGTIITPPMLFSQSEDNQFSNTYGFGNAPFDGARRISLPLVQR